MVHAKISLINEGTGDLHEVKLVLDFPAPRIVKQCVHNCEILRDRETMQIEILTYLFSKK